MLQYVEKPAIISLKVNVKTEQLTSFADWQAKLNSKIAAASGFISLEFLSPTALNKEWMVVQRFGSLKYANEWKSSSEHSEVMNDLKKIVGNDRVEEVMTDESSIAESGVTEVIIAEVSSENEQAYRFWSAKIHQVEAKAKGFRGVYVQSPVQNNGKYWITFLQFDSMSNLDRWLVSPERQNLLDESKTLVSYLETHRVISPYAGWFASIAKVSELPALWKQTMIILLVLFPIVMLEFKYLLPLLTNLNISLSTFIGNAISVSLISFPMMPIAIYFLTWWLTPKAKHRHWATLVGTLLVIALYLLEVWTFWDFV